MGIQTNNKPQKTILTQEFLKLAFLLEFIITYLFFKF